MTHRILTAFVASFLAIWGTTDVRADVQVQEAKETLDVTVKLNGLEITLDGCTGAIRRLDYPGPGTILEAEATEAGLVDVAYPIEQFEPLRLAARHSSGATIEKQSDRVVIRLAKLGPSRGNFNIEGEVAAAVTLRADTDGRSIILSCEIENRSQRPLRQIVFPELRGLVPVAGKEQTILKTCALGSPVFKELTLPDADQWYAINSSTAEYQSGGMGSKMWGRWLDLGGLNGGFSLFPRQWGWDPRIPIVCQLRQATGRLRLLGMHAVAVKPGEKWSSGEWVLTPHRSGWAKGIEPYRQWVQSKAHRQYTMPKHIREELGFRSVWMSQWQPEDPTDAVWRFSDLPELAREAKAHGLCEMVLWAWHPLFDASLPPPFPHLGTEQEFVDAVKECRRIGVNVAPFISVLQANSKTASRYGLTVPNNTGWTYHTDMLPRWDPPYASGQACVQVGPGNAKWQDDVAEACRRWGEKGVNSFCWDQYWTVPGKPSMQDLTARICDEARRRDPQSTFSGEALWNVEIDCQWLDYTWNWQTYRDYQAFVNAFPGPRLNVNINRSVKEARFAFMDNLFLNVWPSKPDNINGSERIANVPELSKTLKTCAALRKQFLRYFTEGIMLGNCLLTEPSQGVRCSAYVLPDRVLAIVLNEGPETSLACSYDLASWVEGKKMFTMTQYDESGRAMAAKEVSATGNLQTPKLRHLEMVIFEFVAK